MATQRPLSTTFTFTRVSWSGVVRRGVEVWFRVWLIAVLLLLSDSGSITSSLNRRVRAAHRSRGHS